jgi:Family of unknown function (DUF6502)
MQSPYNVNQSVIAALAQLLTPLVRMLVRNGVTFGDFTEIAKQTYVRVCSESDGPDGVKPSEARIAIVSGLARQEVRRIAEVIERRESWKSGPSKVAAAIHGWLTDKDFVGPYGVPRLLQFESDEDGAATFVDLVSRHVVNADANEVLQELVRSGAVTQSGGTGQLLLKNRELQIEGLESGVVDFYAREIRRFLDTSLLNMSVSRSEKIYQRWVIPDDGICQKDWDRFASEVRARLDPVLSDLDERISRFDKPEFANEKGLSVGVGFYVFREPTNGPTS